MSESSMLSLEDSGRMRLSPISPNAEDPILERCLGSHSYKVLGIFSCACIVEAFKFLKHIFRALKGISGAVFTVGELLMLPY